MIKEIIADNSKIIGAYAVLMLAFPLGEVVLPYYYGKVIERIPKDKPKNIFKNNKQYFTIIIGLWVVNQVLRSAMDKLDAIFIPRLKSHVRKHMVLKTLKAYRGHYDDPEVGEMIAQLVKMPHVMRDLFYQLRYFIIPTTLVLIAAIGYLFFVDINLGLIGLFGMVIFFALIYSFSKGCFTLSEDCDEYHNKLCEECCDILSNMINIFASGLEDEELERFEKFQQEYNNKHSQTIGCAARFRTLFNTLYFALFAAVNGYGIYLYSQKKISMSSLSSVLIVMIYAINNLSGVSSEIDDFISNVGVLQKTQKTLNKMTEQELSSGTDIFDISSGHVIFHNVVVKKENFTLRFSGEFYPGEKVAIIGQVGSGKSTLIHSLMGYHTLESGKVTIDGKNVANIDLNYLRKQIAYVPQTPRLFNRTVLENICYGSDIKKEDVENALSSLNITQINKDDLSRKAGKNGSHLSGGQKQIVYLLRLLLRSNIKIVILDEPTASLDENSRQQVLSLIEMLMLGKTTIIVTHDPSLMKLVNRKIILSKK